MKLRKSLLAILIGFSVFLSGLTLSCGSDGGSDGSSDDTKKEDVKKDDSKSDDKKDDSKSDGKKDDSKSDDKKDDSKSDDKKDDSKSDEKKEDENKPSYTVTFDTDGGSEIAAITVVEGKTAARPSEPTKTGFAFDDWYSDSARTTAFSFSTAITGNITLYAKWKTATFKVSFNTDGGTVLAAQTIEYNNKASKPSNPEKPNCTFGGWYTSSAFTDTFNFDEPITKTTTVYAKWNLADNTKKVEFVTDGGTAIAWQAVKSGEKATKPADPVKTGSTFLGWYTSAEYTTVFDFDTVTITADTKIYAKWSFKISGSGFDVSVGHDAEVLTISRNGSVYSATEGFNSYKWYIEGTAVSGATSRTFDVSNITLPSTVKVRGNKKYSLSVMAVKNGEQYVDTTTVTIE